MSPSKVSIIEFEKFYNIIDGKQRGSKEIHHGVNPATGQELWDIPIASEQDLNDAVAGSKKAFPAWRDTPLEKRKELLLKFAELCQAHSEELTKLLCKETGKPKKFAGIEVGGLAGFIQYHCECLVISAFKPTYANIVPKVPSRYPPRPSKMTRRKSTPNTHRLESAAVCIPPDIRWIWLIICRHYPMEFPVDSISGQGCASPPDGQLHYREAIAIYPVHWS
jgi:hypothetical protein